MSTLNTIAQNLADLVEVVQNERRIAAAERDAMIATVAALREGILELERNIHTAFQDREDTLLGLLGSNGGPALDPQE